MSLTDRLKQYTKKAASMLLAAGIFTGVGSCATLVVNALGHDNSKPYSGQIENITKVKQKDSIDMIGYNIAHCRGAFPPAKNDFRKNLTIKSKQQVHECLDTLAELFIEADIVCLNEADWSATWSYDVNYPKYLAEKADFNYYSFGTKWSHLWPFLWIRKNDIIFPLLKTNVGNAILSKYPIVSAKNKSFDGEDAVDWLMGEHKYLDALVDVDGEKVRVICTHLDSDSVENRMLEAKKLVQEVRYSDVPLIIGTDFNSVLPIAKKKIRRLGDHHKKDKTMDIIVDSGLFNIYMENVDPADENYWTSYSDRYGGWNKTIDFLITTKDLEIEKYYVLPAVYSDHKAVFTRIKLKK